MIKLTVVTLQVIMNVLKITNLMSKKHYWKLRGTSSIKKKSYFKKKNCEYGIPEKDSKLEKWFKKEEERIRKKNKW